MRGMFSIPPKMVNEMNIWLNKNEDFFLKTSAISKFKI